MQPAKLVMPGPGLDGANMVKMINQENVTLMAGVPTVWLGIYNYSKENGINLPTVKKALVGGSALPESLLRAFELKVKFYQRTAKHLDTYKYAARGYLPGTSKERVPMSLQMMAGSRQVMFQLFIQEVTWK